MTWRLARSLVQLLAEVDLAAPRRSRRSDGSIGDEAHRIRPSDHNPDADGVVHAIDVTDDAAGGHEAARFADWLRRTRDPRLKYVIDEGRIFSRLPAGGRQAWSWGSYSGANPHSSHSHISVAAGAPGDDASAWGWRPGAGGRRQEDIMLMGDTGPTVGDLQRLLNEVRRPDDATLDVDEDYGPNTRRRVKQEQRRALVKQTVTGVADPLTVALVVQQVSRAPALPPRRRWLG